MTLMYQTVFIKEVDVVFFIGAMTGTDRADAINARLAEVAQEKNIALAPACNGEPCH